MLDLKKLAAEHRVWAEVDLDCLAHNYRVARALAPNSAVMPVIKADAYGHGAVESARLLGPLGAPWFAVATADEALQLRRHGVGQPVLLLDGAPVSRVRELARNGVTVAAAGVAGAKAYADALRGETLDVHVKLDTGMRRLGLDAADRETCAAAIAEISAMRGLRVTGLFTHFAAADCDDGLTARQAALFAGACGESKLPRHCANSAAILAHPDTHLDLVREGIMLYGYDPRGGDHGAGLRPVMSLRAAIMQVKTISDGDGVGYGLTWTASGARRIATVAVGYADGLPRCCSNRIDMLVRGRRAPQVGRICMDMCMLDVTDIPDAAAGDVATVYGADGAEAITAETLADVAGTIPYEVLCAVSKRVPRVYVQGGNMLRAALSLDHL